MTRLYLTENKNIYDKIKKIASDKISAPKILKTENGKPYFEDNPVYFSLSHSGSTAAIAFCDSPVGVDIELTDGRTHTAVIKRFSERERTEIKSESDFLAHWTAREAFVKMRGDRLSDDIKRLEFFGGRIYLDGAMQNFEISFYSCADFVCAVCADDGRLIIERL